MLTVSILGPPNAGKSTLFNRLLCKASNRSYRLSVDKKKYRKSRSQSLVGRKNAHHSGMAIVSATAGTTRDRRECIGRIGGTEFRLWDTAGVEGALTSQQLMDHKGKSSNAPSKLQYDMMQQTVKAACSSDLVLLMLDAKHAGVTADLLETAKWLRKVSTTTATASDTNDKTNKQKYLRSKPRIMVLANKLEGDHWNYEGSTVMEHLAEVETRLGFGEPIPISAQHGEGMADIAVAIDELGQEVAAERRSLMDTWFDDELDTDRHVATEEKPLQLAILGRQNVGKSTLVNALLGQERVIAGATPGLTRDAIVVDWYWRGRPVKLVDTAGIRKRPRRDHTDDIEDLAVQDAMRAMKVADVAVLVLDAEARLLQRQELAIADAVLKEGRALVIAANKMDLIVEADYSQEDFAGAVREQLEARFPILRNTPIIAMSSLTGEAVEDLMPVVFDARDRWAQTISTGQLNRWLAEVLDGRSPPMVSGKPLRIKYMMQAKGRPPTFLLFCNNDKLPDSYARYLVRHFQDTFRMFGMEIRLAVKKSAQDNPFDPANKKKRRGYGLGGHAARKSRQLRERRETYSGCSSKEEGRSKAKKSTWRKRR